jgi:hypothetical protein
MNRSLFTAAVLGLAAVSLDLRAAFISGTFSGIALHSRINATSPTPGNFDGAPVAGTFGIDMPAGIPPYSADPPSGAFWVGGMAVTLGFDAEGRHVEFTGQDESGPSFLTLWNDSGGQGAYITAGSYPYWNAGLTLAGPGGLFRDLDPATFDPRSVAAGWSSAWFFAGRDFGADVAITRIEFDGYSVPEPPPWLLMMVGPGCLAAFHRRRLRSRLG